MSDAIISVEQLGKKYRIDHLAKRGSYKTLRETITYQTRDLLTGWFSRNGNGRAPKRGREEFWALRDVSFEVRQGEVLGIIGRNGAGKSTLLKILSRITEPTEGRVRIRGRVASLLEVGTGFHPELTGRENIFLNGAILGMGREEIRKKFDEIVDFAGTEKFLDTPVKRYSSGMYVRLAFAVAAHLEPEILIVDEVLAVGDAKFQKKCLGKMQDVSKGGRTVIFVSHQIAAVQRLCSQGILLRAGEIEVSGGINEVLDHYLSDSAADASGHRQVRLLDGECRVAGWSIDGGDAGPSHSCISRQLCTFRVEIESKRRIPGASLGFVIRNLAGDLLLSANSKDNLKRPFDIDLGKREVVVTVRLPLKMGHYQLELAIADEQFKIIDHWVAQPLLSVLSCTESSLPAEWHGLINEPIYFEVPR
jgi:ABC-type polysaccharide/polyol phosphate transport system ATPase subunit